MYVNLKDECKRKGISRHQIANLWGVSYNTVCEKMNGRSRLYYEEALMLRNVFFPEFNMEYLFFHKCQKSVSNYA